MKSKMCSKCGIKKKLSEFGKQNDHKKGLCSQCKYCRSLAGKIYHQFHKELINKRNKKYADAHREEKAKTSKTYYESHKEELLKQCKLYRDFHKKERKEANKKYQRTYRKERRKRQKERMKTDINFKIRRNLRSRVFQALKKNAKSLPTMFLIGCEIEYLVHHLQCQFTKGMNWDNHGNGWNGKKQWHIDHIKPCASFDLTKTREQKKCFNYTNLQPLWAVDNRKKGNKIR